MSKLFLSLAITMAFSVASPALAQLPAPTQPTSNIKRTMLQKVDIPGTNYDAFSAIAEVAPGASSGRHTHPGPEAGYVIDGEFTLMIDGQPTKVLNAGDSYQVPANTVHDVKAGDKGMKVMAVYMVEKGNPLQAQRPKAVGRL